MCFDLINFSPGTGKIEFHGSLIQPPGSPPSAAAPPGFLSDLAYPDLHELDVELQGILDMARPKHPTVRHGRIFVVKAEDEARKPHGNLLRMRLARNSL